CNLRAEEQAGALALPPRILADGGCTRIRGGETRVRRARWNARICQRVPRGISKGEASSKAKRDKSTGSEHRAGLAGCTFGCPGLVRADSIRKNWDNSVREGAETSWKRKSRATFVR